MQELTCMRSFLLSRYFLQHCYIFWQEIINFS